MKGAEGWEESERQSRKTAIPDYVKREFDSRIEECKRGRDANGLPPLYAELQTFWYPRISTWFLLHKRMPTPNELYSLEFFLWDPLALCDVPCPNCKHTLRRHSHIRSPRRCVRISSTFWIIGFRYYCPNCRSSKDKTRQAYFASWNSRILAVIPPALAAEFPAQLTHRSAIELGTVDLMRSCFQTGMGSKQFSDMMRVQHLLKYDQLHLQYLHYISSRPLATWAQIKYQPFPPFEDRSPQGFGGYVPSGKLCRNVYVSVVTQRRKDFNHHMSLLSAKICAIDYSFKVSLFLGDHASIINSSSHIQLDSLSSTSHSLEESGSSQHC